MGMPFELQTMIITNGFENRLDQNFFELVKDGYHLYPLHVPIPVKRSIDGDLTGEGIIQKLELSEGKTTIIYELLKLKSIN